MTAISRISVVNLGYQVTQNPEKYVGWLVDVLELSHCFCTCTYQYKIEGMFLLLVFLIEIYGHLRPHSQVRMTIIATAQIERHLYLVFVSFLSGLDHVSHFDSAFFRLKAIPKGCFCTQKQQKWRIRSDKYFFSFSNFEHTSTIATVYLDNRILALRD